MSKYANGTFLTVTGASQGIGRTIAIDFAKQFVKDCTIVLMARSGPGLSETQSQINQLNKNIDVHVFPIDLSRAENKHYEEIFDKVLSKTDTTKIENAVIIHNAGYVGTLDETTKLTDLGAWKKYYEMNLFSAVVLNSVFLTKMSEKMTNLAKKFTVVNISSLCGSQPFKNMSMYGSAKAARNLFFKVLAEERPDVTVLNYSPGPVDTAMVEEVISNVKDVDIKKVFTGLKEEKTILSTSQTVRKFLEVLEKGEFKSGDIVDYYDRV